MPAIRSGELMENDGLVANDMRINVPQGFRAERTGECRSFGCQRFPVAQISRDREAGFLLVVFGVAAVPVVETKEFPIHRSDAVHPPTIAIPPGLARCEHHALPLPAV